MQLHLSRDRANLLRFAAVVLVLLALAVALGPVLLPFALNIVIAYVLHPLVGVLERWLPWRKSHPGYARGTAIGVNFQRRRGSWSGPTKA